MLADVVGAARDEFSVLDTIASTDGSAKPLLDAAL